MHGNRCPAPWVVFVLQEMMASLHTSDNEACPSKCSDHFPWSDFAAVVSYPSELHGHQLSDDFSGLGIGRRKRSTFLLINLQAQLERLARVGARLLQGSAIRNQSWKRGTPYGIAAFRLRPEYTDVLCVDRADCFFSLHDGNHTTFDFDLSRGPPPREARLVRDSNDDDVATTGQEMPFPRKKMTKQEFELFQKATEAMRSFGENPDALHGFVNALKKGNFSEARMSLDASLGGQREEDHAAADPSRAFSGKSKK